MWEGKNLSEIPQLVMMEPTPTLSKQADPRLVTVLRASLAHLCGACCYPMGGLGECTPGTSECLAFPLDYLCDPR